MEKEKIFTNRRLDRLSTKHTDHVVSFPFNRAPESTHEGISDWEFVSSLPMVRLTNARLIVLNENFPGWKRLLVILMALTQLPDSLLVDIFKMDSEKYKDVDLFTNIGGNDDEDSMRRLVYVLAPEIAWARGNETLKSKIPYQK